MRREIKFRAWDITGKCWVTNNLGIDCHGMRYWILGYGANPVDRNDYELMQFTGLHDSKGREIFEGDVLEIVKAHDEGCGCDHCFPYQKGVRLKVVWFEGSFGLLPATYEVKDEFCDQCAGYIGLMSPNHEIPIGFFVEVIGNIHENPLLAQDKKEAV